MLSDAMKKRATNKVDLSGPVRQANIHSRGVMDVLVGADGNVVCVQGVRGHPMLLHQVEDILRLWRFKPLIENNVPIAYVGQMDFMLCNINCGKKGPSMTLLK